MTPRIDRQQAEELYEAGELTRAEAQNLRQQAKADGWNVGMQYSRGVYSTFVVGPRTWEPDPAA